MYLLLDEWAENTCKIFYQINDLLPEENILYYDEEHSSEHIHSEECATSFRRYRHTFGLTLTVKSMLTKLVDTICA
jgi:hypothetical protein